MLNIIGKVSPPPWMNKWGSDAAEVGKDFGLILFFSNMLKLATVAAGLFGLINIILAGYGYLTAGGDAEKVTNAGRKITNSLWGLILIAASFTIAAIFGWLLFGDATMIIQPKITGAGD